VEKFAYILVDLGTILIPFIFSFHPKLKFNRKWRSTFLSISIVAVFFIAWDVLYTKMGVWGFNTDYLIGINFINLPIEEILFFFCIPYACLYTYHCLKLFRPINTSKITQWITYKLCVSLVVVGLFYIENIYTSVTFISLSILLFLIQFNYSPKWMLRLYSSLVVLIIPFLIVNGILTGTGLENPIVWYNENEIIGLRVVTIPIEDFFYGFLLILINVFLFEKFEYLNDR
jgi:lycopene cyclase domain-containing protein